MTNYLSAIKQSLYPQWQYTGGYITVSESEDSKIVLQGYAEPDSEEAQILIKKVESIAGVKPYWQRIASGEPPILLSELPNLTLGATTIEETTEEAEQTIEGLVKFVNTLQSGIHTKAVEDVKSMFELFDSARKAAEINLQNLIKYSQDRDKQAREGFNQFISESFNQQASNFQRALSSVSQFWKESMVDTIKSIDFHEAKEGVKKMQKQFPNECPWQISNRLMHRKAIYAMLLGSAGSIVPGLTVLIDFGRIPGLLMEMIYQISVAYGFNELETSETSGEILSIWLALIASKFWAKKGLDFMTNNIPVYGVVVSAATTLMMFYATGYLACEFYNEKSTNIDYSLIDTDTFNSLDHKVETYTEKLILEESTLAETAAQILAMKEQLAPA